MLIYREYAFVFACAPFTRRDYRSDKVYLLGFNVFYRAVKRVIWDEMRFLFLWQGLKIITFNHGFVKINF